MARESPEHVLTTVVTDLSRQLTCHVGWNPPLGKALVFRAWPLRSLHVVGDTPMAEALRSADRGRGAPGWGLTRSRAAARPCSARHARCTASQASSGSTACSTGKDSRGPRKSPPPRTPACSSSATAARNSSLPCGGPSASWESMTPPQVRRTPGSAGIRARRRRRPPCLRRWPGRCTWSPGGRLPNEVPARSGTCSPSRPASRSCRLRSPAAGTVSVSWACSRSPARCRPGATFRSWPSACSTRWQMTGAG